MYESDDIVKYLFNEYGDGEVPLALNMGLMTAVSNGVALMGRTGRGSVYRAAKMPESPLVFWGYDVSPFCKVGAREECRVNCIVQGCFVSLGILALPSGCKLYA